jgi:hypothetical protein
MACWSEAAHGSSVTSAARPESVLCLHAMRESQPPKISGNASYINSHAKPSSHINPTLFLTNVRAPLCQQGGLNFLELNNAAIPCLELPQQDCV